MNTIDLLKPDLLVLCKKSVGAILKEHMIPEVANITPAIITEWWTAPIPEYKKVFYLLLFFCLQMPLRTLREENFFVAMVRLLMMRRMMRTTMMMMMMMIW